MNDSRNEKFEVTVTVILYTSSSAAAMQIVEDRLHTGPGIDRRNDPTMLQLQTTTVKRAKDQR